MNDNINTKKNVFAIYITDQKSGEEIIIGIFDSYKIASELANLLRNNQNGHLKVYIKRFCVNEIDGNITIMHNGRQESTLYDIMYRKMMNEAIQNNNKNIINLIRFVKNGVLENGDEKQAPK